MNASKILVAALVVTLVPSGCSSRDTLDKLEGACKRVSSGDRSTEAVKGLTGSMNALVEERVRASVESSPPGTDVEALLVSDAAKIHASVEIYGKGEALEAAKRFLVRMHDELLKPEGEQLPISCKKLAGLS